MTTVGEFLQQTTMTLQAAGIDTARLDSLILLEDTLRQDRALLLAHLEAEIPVPILARLYKKVIQRSKHTPLAYIRGKANFYGREFVVNEHVLVPRPETEIMIDLLKKIAPLTSRTTIIDVGAGSGCLGITAALELPDVSLSLIEIDPDALTVAQQNATAFSTDVFISEQDLLKGQVRSADIILANLPYVPEKYPINKAASHEPAIALFAGPDGLDAYRLLFQQAAALPAPPLHVLTESLTSQHDALCEIAATSDYKLTHQKGLIQHFQHG